MIQIIWQFRAKETKRAEFLRYYSSTGLWTVLFQKSPSYNGTKLLQDTRDRNRYVTVDVWENLESFENFKRKFGGEYKTIDKECEGFTEDEQSVGVFQVVQT